MKFKILLLALCLVSANVSAQFTFLDDDSNPVSSGTTVTFGQDQVGDPLGFYKYFVTNDAAGAIFMKAELLSTDNADGSDFEICFGLCYTGITVGQKFPNNGSVFIEQGGQTLPGNHLANTVTNSQPMEFAFRFYQTDQAGTTEIGNDFFITYRYDPALGLDDNELIDFEITSTLINEYLEVTALERVMVRISDKRGRKVKSKKIAAGTQRISMNGLPSDVYFVTITNDRNVSETIKVVKK
jgi:hypothetical protein